MKDEKKYEPIVVLWIEDNPLQNSLTGKDINARNDKPIFSDVFNETFIPAISFKGELESCHQFFELKVLQHPEEIKEYITMCLKVEDVKGSLALGETKNVVPNIVVFDYRLSDNIPINKENSNVPYFDKNKIIREYINPNFALQKEHGKILDEVVLHLEQNHIEEYSTDDFIKRINKNFTKDKNEVSETVRENDNKQLREDDLGLLSGITITRLYRNHICVGLPATYNKADYEKLHAFSKYYEWINEYDMGSMLSRSERGSKDWDSIIKDAVIQLRERIKNLVKGNKITLALGQLMELANGKIPAKENERIFTFYSDFGKHSLPLNGLFIDVSKEKQDSEIEKFCMILLNQLIENTKAGMNVEILSNAFQAADTLMKEYKDDVNLFKRLRLSELKFLEKNIGSISAVDKIELDNLCKYFNEKKKYFDLGEFNFGVNNETTKRYAALFTMLQIFKTYQNYVSETSNIESHLEIEPTVYDYIMGIFPRPENPQILPFHDAKKLTDLTDKKLVGWTGLKLNAILGANKATMKVADNSILKEEEKLFLKAYYLGLFSSIETIIGTGNGELKYPSWIN